MRESREVRSKWSGRSPGNEVKNVSVSWWCLCDLLQPAFPVPELCKMGVLSTFLGTMRFKEQHYGRGVTPCVPPAPSASTPLLFPANIISLWNKASGNGILRLR